MVVGSGGLSAQRCTGRGGSDLNSGNTADAFKNAFKDVVSAEETTKVGAVLHEQNCCTSGEHCQCECLDVRKSTQKVLVAKSQFTVGFVPIGVWMAVQTGMFVVRNQTQHLWI